MPGEISPEKLLTKSECSTIAKNALNAKNVEIVEFKLDPVCNKTLGFLGEYFYLTILLKKDNAMHTDVLSCFVKTLPLKESSQKELIKEMNVFSKEIAFYTDLFPKMDKYNYSINSEKWHAVCYYAKDNLMVMENLNQQGYKHAPFDGSITNDCIKVTLRCMARMHANSLAFEINTGSNIREMFSPYLKELQIDGKNGWFLAGTESIKKIANVHPKFQSAKVKGYISQYFDKFVAKLFEKVQPSTEFREVFCHRDLWDKNLLFKYSEQNPAQVVDCIILDYQICRYQIPAIDVLTFIYLNTTPTIRKKYMSDYLEYYYKCLVEQCQNVDVDIEKEIPKEQFERSCKYIKLMPLIMSGVYGPIMSLPDGFMNSIKLSDPELFYRYVLVDRMDLIFEQMEKYAPYKNFLLDTVEEIIDYMIDKNGVIE